MANPTVEGRPGASSAIIQRATHALRFWWRDRPTVFVPATLPAATNALAGEVEVITDVLKGVRLVVGEDVRFPWRIPQSLDRDKAIDIRVIWSKPDAATTNVTFTGTQDSFAEDVAIAAPATAFDTVIGAQAGIAVANAMRSGNWGTIAKVTIGSAKAWLVIGIDATTLGAGITNTDIYGIEIRYYRRFID